MPIAAFELGVKEVAGDGSNPRILEYHQHTGLKASDDAVAWCSAFANWCMDKAGLDGSNAANARSWLDWGRACEPEFGCVTVLSRGDPKGWQGHVGFLITFNNDWVWLLAGNQGDAVTVQRFERQRVLGFRLPN